MIHVLLAVPVLLLCTSPATQTEHKRTPPQRFFDWSTPTFSPAEYSARRDALVERLRAAGGGVFLVPSAEGVSHGETFRQADDFIYFTGLELPRSILAREVLGKTTVRSVLFVPATDRRFSNPARRNDFPGRRLAGDPLMKTRSGVDEVLPFSQFAPALKRWASAGVSVAVNHGRGGQLPPIVATLWQQTTEVDALRAHMRQVHPTLALRNAFGDVAQVRMVKSPAEIAVLRRACGITIEGIRAAAGTVRDGVHERSLEGVFEARLKQGGAQRLAFASIIKSGPNSLWPWRILAAHYDRRNRAMQAGELVIFDVGCELHEYATDVGRTFPVSGKFTERQRELVRMATSVSDQIIAAIKPGTTLAALQLIARKAIPKAERRYMQTGLFFGHHIGLAVGDPSLAGAPLAAGMVFTVEPWYYNHDEAVAVFVEDVVLVTKDGAENLTAALPRVTDELEKMVGAR